jgi:hypothetical protein
VVNAFFIRAGGVFVDKPLYFLAEDGLKGAAALGTVNGLIFRPTCVSTI